jgi:hypothetical protein
MEKQEDVKSFGRKSLNKETFETGKLRQRKLIIKQLKVIINYLQAFMFIPVNSIKKKNVPYPY